MHTIYKSEAGKAVIRSHCERYLDNLGIPITRTYVETRYGQTHVLEAGRPECKPIMLLQGGNCINPMTFAWFVSLADEYRIIAPDTIGHPGFSEETRVSAKDESLALWIMDLLAYYKLKQSAFIGPSYGGGIILRLAAHKPAAIACAVLVAPAGIALGSQLQMVKRVLLPLFRFKLTSKKSSLKHITNALGAMSTFDQAIIRDIFRYVKLERNMPKLTSRTELEQYKAPTMVIGGRQDIFFPGDKLIDRAQIIMPSLTSTHVYSEMGYFPAEETKQLMALDIKCFLTKYY